MRIFIGIKMNDETTGKLEHFVQPFKTESTPIRWIKPENYHLSLRFIGEIPEDIWIRIRDKFTSSMFRLSPFPIQVRGCGSFSRGQDIGIFWAGVMTSQPLQTIYNTLEKGLESTGIQPETRPFHPHITLGRNKKKYDFNSFFGKMETHRHTIIAEPIVDRFQIFQSTLLPVGPIYKILKEIPIGTA